MGLLGGGKRFLSEVIGSLHSHGACFLPVVKIVVGNVREVLFLGRCLGRRVVFPISFPLFANDYLSHLNLLICFSISHCLVIVKTLNSFVFN